MDLAASELIDILLVEDNPRDAELNTRALRKEGIQFNAKRVMTEPEFLVGLQDPALELILADVELPALSHLHLAALGRPWPPIYGATARRRPMRRGMPRC